MSTTAWTYLVVGLTFGIYVFIAWRSRAGSTGEFYVAGKHVHPVANGMATAADWMSAASFISMAGLIAFLGYDGSVYLMGWTGGYVLLALLLAPYLRKFGKFTVPDFVGDRYESQTARLVAIIAALFVSFTYVVGQMKGVGVAFSRFLEVEFTTGVFIGMGIVFFYAVLGGMKGITYTQVAQYCVMIFAYLLPAIFISIQLTGTPVPQLGFGSSLNDGSGTYLLEKLDAVQAQLGFASYTQGTKPTIDVFFITMSLMVGTAGLPHVIVRFFTVPRVRDARVSAGYALFFIALLYTTAPAVGAFAKMNLIDTVNNKSYTQVPGWFKNWEETGLLAWTDKNSDGIIQFNGTGPAFDGKPVNTNQRDQLGSPVVKNQPTENSNELYVDRDIMVLANPEIANLPSWVIAFVVAGGLAAALSTAAGLLLVISTSISHDLLKKTFRPQITEKGELLAARIAAGVAVIAAGLAGINPPGFVAQVVAFAFGLAASSFFPAIILGIFTKRMNKEGAIAGMVTGLVFTASYIIYFKFLGGEPSSYLFQISPEGIGTLGMLLNFVVSLTVSSFTNPPSEATQQLVENIRYPRV